MEWKFSPDRPVYQQIVSLMQGAVLSGEYPPGARIPSVRDLAAEAKVNPNTMQRALSELERQQLLLSGGTSGRCVTSEKRVLEAIRSEALRKLAQECAEKFAAYGIAPVEAADLLRQVGREREETE